MNEIKTILAAIRIADAKFSLIDSNDRICVGISGGKDSMILLFALHLYSKFNHTNFTIVPCIIDLGFDNFNPLILEEYCQKLGLKLEVYDGRNVFPILKLNQKDEKHLPCSICSRMKKNLINKAAKKFNCNKVAFAHHKDDAVETLFLNEIYGGRIATFAPKMHLDNDNITFIRPLILVDEKLIIKASKSLNIPVLKSNCPADKHTEREVIKNTLSDLYKKFPTSKENFLTMLSNSNAFDCWIDKIENRIENTSIKIIEVINLKQASAYYEFNHKINDLQNDDFNSQYKHYLVYKNSLLVSTYILNTLDETSIILTKLNFLNTKIKEELFLKVLEYIQKSVFLKFNPCCLKTQLNDTYFCDNYKKDDKYYSITLMKQLSCALIKIKDVE